MPPSYMACVACGAVLLTRGDGLLPSHRLAFGQRECRASLMPGEAYARALATDAERCAAAVEALCECIALRAFARHLRDSDPTSRLFRHAAYRGARYRLRELAGRNPASVPWMGPAR